MSVPTSRPKFPSVLLCCLGVVLFEGELEVTVVHVVVVDKLVVLVLYCLGVSWRRQLFVL